jgi:hypothetical protein
MAAVNLKSADEATGQAEAPAAAAEDGADEAE